MKKLFLVLALFTQGGTPAYAQQYEPACKHLATFGKEVAIGRYTGVAKDDSLDTIDPSFPPRVKAELVAVVDGAYYLRDADTFMIEASKYGYRVYSDCMTKFQKMVR